MTEEELKDAIGDIIYMYAHGVEEDAMTNGEATDKLLELFYELFNNEFNRGRRDLLTFIKVMGTEYEGAFLLKKTLIDALEQEVKQYQNSAEGRSTKNKSAGE